MGTNHTSERPKSNWSQMGVQNKERMPKEKLRDTRQGWSPKVTNKDKVLTTMIYLLPLPVWKQIDCLFLWPL